MSCSLGRLGAAVGCFFGCLILYPLTVVLLDEADVFLEQRSLANLERNALVSVFLRVLEYYDGNLYAIIWFGVMADC